MRRPAKTALIVSLALTCAISPARASLLGHGDPGSDLRPVATRPLPQQDFARPFAEEYTFAGNSPVSLMDPTGEAVPLLLLGALKLAAWGGLIGGTSFAVADTYAQYSTTAGFTAGDWSAGETAGMAGRGALVGAAGGFTFGLAAPAGAGALGYFGASSGWAAFGGAVLGGSAAGGVEGGVSWGLGLSGGSLGENVGRGALFGGLTGGLFHGAGVGAGRLGGPVQSWLRAGPSGGLRRNALAWHVNRFRLNSTRFYTVQAADDAARLRSTGSPWPSAANRAHFGEGVYSWAGRAEAVAYQGRLQSRVPGLEIVPFRVGNRALRSANQLHIGSMETGAATAWVNRHSRLFGDGLPHTYDYVTRPIGNEDIPALIAEHYFRAGFFPNLRFR